MHMHWTELGPRLVCSICFFLSVTPFLCRPASTMGKSDCKTKDFLMAKEPKQKQRNRNKGKGTKTEAKKLKQRQRNSVLLGCQDEHRAEEDSQQHEQQHNQEHHHMCNQYQVCDVLGCCCRINILETTDWKHLQVFVGSVNIEDIVVCVHFIVNLEVNLEGCYFAGGANDHKSNQPILNFPMFQNDIFCSFTRRVWRQRNIPPTMCESHISNNKLCLEFN